MKSYKLFFTLLLSTFFVFFLSCSNDDNNEDGIVGTWNFTKVEADAAANSDLDRIKEQLKREDFSPKITFLGNNTFKTFHTNEANNEEGTYVYKDNTLTLYWNGDKENSDTYGATVSGNTLKIEDDNTEDYKAHDFPNSGVTKAITVFYFTRQ
ncbi:MAG: lipocalin family protein [Prevotella sp.]|jgi:hypothetical protein|nr:lipocalin family protein [Prevotella sp.]